MSSRLPYFKCYPDNALNGTQGLPDALFKVYVRLFWHMYATGGPVKFDDRKLKFLVEKRPQDVRKLVGQLVGMGKLTLDENGFLHNGRTDDEIEKWRINDGEMNAKWRPNGGQMEPHLPRHKSKKPNDPTRTRAHVRDRVQKPDINSRSSSDDLLFNVRASNEALTHMCDFEKKFVEFWAAYPKREGGNPKHPAKLKYLTAVKKGADPEMILKAAKSLALEHPLPTRFVPMAQTWLYQHRFEDSATNHTDSERERAEEQARQRRLRRQQQEGVQ